ALRPDRALRQPRLREAATLLENRKFGLAAKLLREFLESNPRDAAALHLMAETAAHHGRNAEAEALLARSVALAPDLPGARFAYANALCLANKPEAALVQ